MISIFQRFSALSVTLVLLAVATLTFSVKLALRSNIQSGQAMQSTDIGDSCFVFRNAFGIPHIIASSELDVFYTLGVTHAQDRLWQMDLLRRIARGRTARIFGEKTIPADKFFRVLGLSAIAERQYSSLSRQSREMLEAYTKGVNACIEQQRNKLPFEFDALHYEPEPWKATDCLVIERLMAFDMSMSFWTDLAIGEIADSLGVAEALRFVPTYPANSPNVCDLRQSTKSDTSKKHISEIRESRELIKSMSEAMACIREMIGMKGMCSGSNCWVMSKHEGSSKGLIFANDPHLGLVLPPRWYQVHLSCPQFNVVGCSIPGVPGVVSGRNDHIAWGITNVMLDDCDYFIEKVDPANSAFYWRADGQRVRFKTMRDTIEVKRQDHVDTVFLDYRATNRSNVISDVHITRERDSLIRYPASPNALASKYVLTFSWTAQENSDELLSARRLLRCSSWKEFCEAVASWGSPALNFTYADKEGNKGIAPSGIVPVRGDGDANFPHPGWEAKYAWRGFHPASAMPRIYNPPRRFVWSANNQTTRNAPFYLSSLWEPPSRAERIESMLDEYHEYTVRDAQFMQLDQISPNAKFVVQATSGILVRDTATMSKEQYYSLSQMTHWDYAMTAQDVAPAVYTVFHERLMNAIFCYKLSPVLYKKFAFVGSQPMRKVNEILADTSYSWFAGSSDQGRRVYEDIVRRSFREAIDYMKNRFGDDMTKWTYGHLHELTLRHPFHEVDAFRSIVSHEVLNVGGDATTVNNALWSVHRPFDVVVGASMRLVTDLEDSVVYSVLPGGSSGQPLDAHYSDQVQLWSNGGYIPLSMSRIPANGFNLYTVITPKRK